MLALLSLWWSRIIGTFSCAIFDALSFSGTLTYWMYGAGAYYGAPIAPAKADMGELPAGGTIFSKSLWGLKLARRRFR